MKKMVQKPGGSCIGRVIVEKGNNKPAGRKKIFGKDVFWVIYKPAKNEIEDWRGIGPDKRLCYALVGSAGPINAICYKFCQ